MKWKQIFQRGVALGCLLALLCLPVPAVSAEEAANVVKVTVDQVFIEGYQSAIVKIRISPNSQVHHFVATIHYDNTLFDMRDMGVNETLVGSELCKIPFTTIQAGDGNVYLEWNTWENTSTLPIEVDQPITEGGALLVLRLDNAARVEDPSPVTISFSRFVVKQGDGSSDIANTEFLQVTNGWVADRLLTPENPVSDTKGTETAPTANPDTGEPESLLWVWWLSGGVALIGLVGITAAKRTRRRRGAG